MTEMLNTIFITAVVTFFPGLLLGYLWARRKQSSLVQEAYDRAREEFDVERAELSEDLGAQLSKIRHSIIQSVEAYESAAKVVEEKCLKNIKGYTALEASKEEQRQLDFFKTAGSEETSEDVYSENSKVNVTSINTDSDTDIAAKNSFDKEDELLKKDYTENAVKGESKHGNHKENEQEPTSDSAREMDLKDWDEPEKDTKQKSSDSPASLH